MDQLPTMRLTMTKMMNAVVHVWVKPITLFWLSIPTAHATGCQVEVHVQATERLPPMCNEAGMTSMW